MTIVLKATGSYLPSQIITNHDLELTLDTSDTWITQMTGIKQRYVLSEHERFIDGCINAAQNTFDTAGIDPQDIDLIILATTTPEQIMPSSATLLQHHFQINHCIAFDIQAACSGFVYALTNAYALMSVNEGIKNALILGCDAFSKIVDWDDRATSILFGDGFGGALLSKTNDTQHKGIFYTDIGSSCFGKNDLEIPWGVGQGHEAMEVNKPFVTMNGKQVFKAGVERFVAQINKALEKTQLGLDDIAYYIPHQANIRIIESIAKILNVPMEKFQVTLDRQANTSAASIPLALDELIRSKKVKRGDLIMMTGFGAGYTWGTVILEL